MPPNEHNREEQSDAERPPRETRSGQGDVPKRFSVLDVVFKPVVLKYAAITVAVLLVLFFGLSIATAKTLPGNPFYSLKVSVLEEGMSYLKFGASSKGNYYLTLMGRRVDELVALQNNGQINADTFNTVLNEVNEHGTDLNNVIAKEEDAGLTKSEVLFLLRDYVTYARAAERVLEANGESNELEETIEDVRRRALNFYEEKVEQFVVKASSSELKEYLDSQLNEIGTASEGRELGRELQDDVEDELDNVSEALNESNTADAITAASEALRYIEAGDLLAELTIEEDIPVEAAAQATSTMTDETATDTATVTEETNMIE
jgi:hypothetical protein